MKLVKIGRTLDNDVALEDDPTVSRKHAEIFQDDEGNVFLTDLESANGTFVNGNRIHGAVMLNYNDIVKVGNKVLPWRNFLEEEDLDATIAKKIIIEHEEEELSIPISNSKNSFPWGTIIVALLIIIGVVIFLNINEKKPREDPKGTYSGYNNQDYYEYKFSENSYDKTVEITVNYNCIYSGFWKTNDDGDIKIYNIDVNYLYNSECYDDYFIEGTYKVCDKPDCSVDGKYYKNGNLTISPK